MSGKIKVIRICSSIILLTCTLLYSTIHISAQTKSQNTTEKNLSDSKRIYLDATIDAARWIRSTATETSHGRAWPDDAIGAKAISTNLADGLAGKVIFFLEMHRATGDEKYLTDALAGADYLLATIPEALELNTSPPATSLYYGVGGVAFALHNVYKATGAEKYRAGALRCVELIHKHARKEGGGVAWTHYNDLLFGNAGTGLFLLFAHKEMNHAASRDLAIQAGRRLLDKAMKESGGLNWKFRDDRDFILPNFSHGAAGIGYFLATLFLETRQKEFLEGALSAASYLKAVARTEGGVFLVPYGWPNENWKGYYDIGWAHGPAGTARLFYRLWQITKDRSWMELVKACARGIKQSGLPETPKPGFGNDSFKLDRRFGSASAADFFLNLYAETRDREHLDFARQLVEDILKKATRDATGTRWIFPRYAFMEGANSPAAFTGYFYGAAGYGMLMLRFHSTDSDAKWRIRLPDDPF
ncbi:MAG: hypothetical protein L0229_29835 [Blastocatellia bacterium]|nr:hypothetical protein [Blastocatellia bacterium]